ncbi:MAG: hypothetical protein C0494_17660 [Sphingobium sp.]|nr:hypothetical protein [Sphingobium sp.]
MSLVGQILVNLKATLAGTVDIGSVSHDIDKKFVQAIADGVGAGQANQMWADNRTIAASTSENLDLAGSLANALGATLTFTSIKAILIIAAAANANNVVVGGAASNAFALFGDPTDTIAIRPGGCLLITDFNANGYAVTAATGDILKVANSGSGTTVTYDIVIIGEV